MTLIRYLEYNVNGLPVNLPFVQPTFTTYEKKAGYLFFAQ